MNAESQLITAVEVLPGNAADASPALSLTEASEHNTGLELVFWLAGGPERRDQESLVW
jgi:hypothetical protein